MWARRDVHLWDFGDSGSILVMINNEQYQCKVCVGATPGTPTSERLSSCCPLIFLVSHHPYHHYLVLDNKILFKLDDYVSQSP